MQSHSNESAYPDNDTMLGYTDTNTLESWKDNEEHNRMTLEHIIQIGLEGKLALTESLLQIK